MEEKLREQIVEAVRRVDRDRKSPGALPRELLRKHFGSAAERLQARVVLQELIEDGTLNVDKDWRLHAN